MINKKGMEFSWIFAVIIGIVILFLAFYFVGSKITRQDTQEATGTVNSLDILFNPFSYLGAMGAVTSKPIGLSKESSFTFDCDSVDLGSNTISLDTGVSRAVYDKYIFADNFRAKTIQTLSKSFEMPWRIADLIYVFTGDYCFVNVPLDLENELSKLEINNLQIAESLSECQENSTIVCFGSSCQIKVVSTSGNYYQGYVEKNGEDLYFSGDNYALLLGAIFSRDKAYYDCNVQRLAYRLGLEIQVYEKKKEELIQDGCVININLDTLKQVDAALKSRVNQNSINGLYNEAKNIENLNYNSECPLF